MAYLSRAQLWQAIIDDLNNNPVHANFKRAVPGKLGVLKSANKGDVLVFCDHDRANVKSSAKADKQDVVLSFLAIGGMQKSVVDAADFLDPIITGIERRYAGSIFDDGNGNTTFKPMRSIPQSIETMANQQGNTLITLELRTTIKR